MDGERLYDRIRDAVMQGDAAAARALAAEALSAGADPIMVLEKGFTPALRSVGDCWERGDLYLPEMILAAEAVKAALGVLKPHIRARAGSGADGAVCVLGTVKGDIHDIGKNIVGTLLEAFGFSIVDLGTDVDPGRFVGAVRDNGASLVGLSALLTSTMPQMGVIIEALREAGLRTDVRVAVGGAPVTPAYAAEIGADGYAEDGISALRLFQKLAAATSATAAGRTAGEVRDAF